MRSPFNRESNGEMYETFLPLTSVHCGCKVQSLVALVPEASFRAEMSRALSRSAVCLYHSMRCCVQN